MWRSTFRVAIAVVAVAVALGAEVIVTQATAASPQPVAGVTITSDWGGKRTFLPGAVRILQLM